MMLEHLHGKTLEDVGIEGGHLNDMTLYVEEPQTNMNMTLEGYTLMLSLENVTIDI